MIRGIGIDLVEIERVRALLARHGDRARRRLFTPGELADCEERADPAECLAARLAAKEAALKALGVGKGPGLLWTDLETRRSESGQPIIELSGRAREYAERLGVTRATLSLSHEAGIACAMIVFEGSLP